MTGAGRRPPARSWAPPLGILVLTAALGVPGCAAVRPLALPSELRSAPVASEALRRQHEAVFEMFLPADRLGLPDSLKTLARSVCDTMWDRLSGGREFLNAMTLLTRLDALGGESARLRSLVERVGRRRLDEWPLEDRMRLLAVMQTCDNNSLRKIALRGRAFYLLWIYGSDFGKMATGFRPKATVHPRVDEFVQAHMPQFPPTWLTYDSTAHRIAPRDGRLDYVIVGSGPAGSMIAHTLQRAGHRVLLVEQGSFVLPGAMDTRKFPRLKESMGARTSVSGSVLFGNAEAVGGGTTVNIDLAFSPTDEIVSRRIEAWRGQGLIAPDQFTAADVARAYDTVKRRIGTRSPAEAEINGNNRVLWEGARRNGRHPRLYDLNTHAPGAWPSPVTDKRSAVTGLLLGAMQAPEDPLALIPDARVLEVLLHREGGMAVARGVRFVARHPWDTPGVLRDPLGLHLRTGDTITVEADRTILCAGTLGSAALLLQSGIRNPNIGRGIVAHPAMPVIGEFDHVIDAYRGTEATVYLDDYALSHGFLLEAMAAGPEYAAVMVPGNGEEVYPVVSAYRRLAGFGVMLIDTPSSSNRITLDASGRPVVHYRLTPDDRARFRFAVAEAVRIMFRAGAKQVIVPTTEEILPSETPDVSKALRLTRIEQADAIEERLAFVPNRTILTSAHLQSSNKMGADPRTSVVSHEGRVWGTENLYVMDASVFPSSVGANPMQSIYTLAMLFAEHLDASPADTGR